MTSYFCPAPPGGRKAWRQDRHHQPQRTPIRRTGIRVGDLLDREDFTERLAATLREKNELITAVYGGRWITVLGVL